MSKVYITWHYTTHGIAYLKHVLSAFYNHRSNSEEKINWENLNQKDLNTVFDNPNKKGNGIKFDKIIYITAPQKSFDELSTRRFAYRHNYKDIPEFQRIERIYDDIRNKDELCYNLEKEREYIKQTYPEIIEEYSKTAIDIFEENLWMDIQHYDVKTQIKWLKEKSNFINFYSKDSFEEKELNILDLRDVKEITHNLKEYIENLPENDEYFINVSLGSAETQVAWHILAEYNVLPPNTRFFTTYDNKTSNKDEKFKLFSIKKIETKLFEHLGGEFSILKNQLSEKRQLVYTQLNYFIKRGFSILLIGERGTGKSYCIKKICEEQKHKFKKINCATFTNDTLAETRLFGYKKGAFTDAKEDTPGIIEESANGTLFMDEVHTLSKSIQEKLMTAFQTEEDDTMTICRVGDNKKTITVPHVKLVFATNKTIKDLRELLLPDFYDRIVQYVIEIPPLRETREDIEKDWEYIWTQLKFEKEKTPKNPKLITWLKKQPLNGNYRDLQKIAIYYQTFYDYKQNDKERICQNLNIPCNEISYIKEMFRKYQSPKISTEECITIKTKEIEEVNAENLRKEFYYQLFQWAFNKYKNLKTVADRLGVDVRTLNNWKNRR